MDFNPNEAVEQGSDTPIAIIDARPEAEQLSVLRARAIERSKVANSGEYSFNHPAAYFESLAGEESSEFDFGTLRTVSKMLCMPGPFWRLQVGTQWNWIDGRYNGKTGRWISDDQKVTIAIEDLRKAVDERIVALSLSAVAVYEWALAEHHHEEDKVFWRQSLEDRIKRFCRE
jgi:hypothetical protein